MKKVKETYRMYGFVPYNLSEIQKGIQFGHAVVEYANSFSKDAAYKQWSTVDKTFIILNGGTTNNGGLKGDGVRSFHETVEIVKAKMSKSKADGMKLLREMGGMQNAAYRLSEIGVKFSVFQEPDLNNAVTGIAFLVSNKVFDNTAESDLVMSSVYEYDSDESIRMASKYTSSKIVSTFGSADNLLLKLMLKQYRLA